MKDRIQNYLPNLKESWLLVLVLLFGGFVCQGLFLWVVRTCCPDQEWLTKAVSYVMLFLPLLAVVNYRCRNLDTFPQTHPSFGIPLSVPLQSRLPKWVVYLLLLFSVPCLALLSEGLIAWLPAPEWFNQLMQELTGGNLWINLLSVAVLAPLLEEFFCRGLVLRGLLRHATPTRAILWSAFIFAIIHLNPWQALPAFLMGIFFGWVYYRTGSLWTAIFLHATNNGLCVLIPNLFPQLGSDYRLTDLCSETLPVWVCYAAATVLLLVIIRILHQNTQSIVIQSHESK